MKTKLIPNLGSGKGRGSNLFRGEGDASGVGEAGDVRGFGGGATREGRGVRPRLGPSRTKQNQRRTGPGPGGEVAEVGGAAAERRGDRHLVIPSRTDLISSPALTISLTG